MITTTVLEVEVTGQSVDIGTGITEDGRTVRFGIEARYSGDIANGLEGGEDVVVELEGWQILG